MNQEQNLIVRSHYNALNVLYYELYRRDYEAFVLLAPKMAAIHD